MSEPKSFGEPRQIGDQEGLPQGTREVAPKVEETHPLRLIFSAWLKAYAAGAAHQQSDGAHQLMLG